MRPKSEQLVTIEKDAIFNLLPFAIRTYDNGALKLLFRAISDQHNFTIEKLRELIRLQDPWLAAAFKSEDLGESSQDYKEYLGLIDRWSSLSEGQKAYVRSLDDKIPKSIQAGKFENTVLSALASNVGERTYGGKLRAGLRGLIASAISRHHIKGSHSSVYALGLVSGVFELSVKELWSRYSLSEPDYPASLKNNDDFAYVPDIYPYFPTDGKYTGQKVEQYQIPYGVYNPRVLDDAAGLLYEEVFKWCVPARTSPYWYNKVVNGKNPFGRFTGDVTSKLISGTYRMSGGSDNTRAYVLIPSLVGTQIFEADSYGSWGNNVFVSVFNNRNGTQDVTLTGPRSKIKFKTSYFDLTVAADISVYPLIYPSIPVLKNSSASYLDGDLGRILPEYPITTVRDGTDYLRVISDPAVHFQVDNRKLNELFGIVKLMFESIRPATRTARFEHFGILLRDQVQYAPILTINEVRLQSRNGSVWELSLDGDGIVSWTLSNGEVTRVPSQYERLSKRMIRWSISDAGVFRAIPINQADPENFGEAIVYYRSQVFNGFVYSENGILRSSITSPSLLLDTIHTDGTFDEQVLREQYTKYSESPIPGTEVYMSEDATYDDEPSQELQFQTGPEDGVSARPMLVDFSGSHVDAHFGTEEELGFPGSNWWYDSDGEVVSNDIRLRSAGIAPGFLEAVPTGNSIRQDGLVYGYPIHFLNYHNTVPWRDRVDNSPKYSQYTYDSPDRFTGAERIDFDLSEHDGPIEGSTQFGKGSGIILQDDGSGITPTHMCGGGANGPEIDSLLLSRAVRLSQICYRYVSITNHGGYMKVKTNRLNTIQIGSVVYIEYGTGGSPEEGNLTFDDAVLSLDNFVLTLDSGTPSLHQGFHRVTEVISGYEFVTETVYTSTETNGYIFCKTVELHVSSDQDATIRVVREENTSEFNAIVFQRSLDGLSLVRLGDFTMTNELEKEEVFSVAKESVLLVYTSTESLDMVSVSLPDNTIDMLGELMWHGGDRSTPEITIINDGDNFFDYDEDGKSPFLQINGNKWWRGGTWSGSNDYTIETLNRNGLPGVLTSTSATFDYMVAKSGGNNFRLITSTGDYLIAKLD